jgi:glycosyltransferase involved in cell wall biosynthesis
MFICSSRKEIEYYKYAFKWDDRKLAYVPFHTDPNYLSFPNDEEDDYILSVGRTFRDYETLIEAVKETKIPTIIIASKNNIAKYYTDNIKWYYDIDILRVSQYIARSRLVVIPLMERKISIGQSVLLHAMSIGKATIVTETNGTMDYVDNMKTGIFVKPQNVEELKAAINVLYNDNILRSTIGKNAKESVKIKYMPMNYAIGVCRVLTQSADNL